MGWVGACVGVWIVILSRRKLESRLLYMAPQPVLHSPSEGPWIGGILVVLCVCVLVAFIIGADAHLIEEHHRRGERMITEDRPLRSEQCVRVGEHKWAIGLVRRRTCVLLAGRWFGGWGGLGLIICVPLYVGEDQRACW